MAERFVQEATAQLSPVYDQQVQAVQGQIPAIQQLYASLLQGLEAQGATQKQGILESSAARGLTRSSIPTDLQTTLAQTMTMERGKLGAQQAKDVADINTRVGDINIAKANSITGLANSLFDRDLKERQFQQQKEQAEREFQMKQQQLAAENAARNSQRAAANKSAQVSPAAAALAVLGSRQGGDGYVSPSSFRIARDVFLDAGGNNKEFMDRFWYLTGASAGQKNANNWKAYYYG